MTPVNCQKKYNCGKICTKKPETTLKLSKSDKIYIKIKETHHLTMLLLCMLFYGNFKNKILLSK